MRIKQKFIKQKQLTDRPNPILKTTQPLTTRLQSEYLFNQPSNNTHQNSNHKFMQKQNFNMGNTKPMPNQYISHNVIQIDNYQDKKFKTQQGFQPMMTKSRFMGEQEQTFQSSAVYKTSDNIVLRKEKARKTQERMYDSVDQIQNQRPLTFGLARKVQPMKSSVEYQEDIKMKNEILNELNLRKSQQSLLASKDFSASGFGDVVRCNNHNNKKAKYRLIADLQAKDEQMVYCSKCAINLLQQGFKVEELKPDAPLTCKLAKSQQNFVSYNTMMNSVGSSTRLQQMRNFEQKLNEAEIKVSEALERNACTQRIQQLQRQSSQMSAILDWMIKQLQQQKQMGLNRLNEQKKKRVAEYNRKGEELRQQLLNISEMKKQMKQYRNRFIIMKDNQFKFLINSFTNKIQNYGQQNQVSFNVQNNLQNLVQQILICFSQFANNFHQGQVQVNNSFNATSKQTANHDDEFICREIKGPFRTLFPQEQSNASGRKENQEDSPSFSKCHNDTFETMQRSLQNSQQFRF